MEALESKNYYELLGLPFEATTEQIKEAYKEIARVYHPDSTFYSEIVQSGMTEEDQKIYKMVTNAYNTLVNPAKRAEYDKLIPKGLKGWDESSAPGMSNGGATQSAQAQSRPRPVNRGFGQVYEFEEDSPEQKNAQSIHDIIRERQQRVQKRQNLILLVCGIVVLMILLTGWLIFGRSH